MGRRKIEIQPITHDRNRSVTFLKRKNGLFKKAYELGVLCSVDVCVIVFGHNGKLHEYSSGDVNHILERRIKYTGDRDCRRPADFNGEKGGADDNEDEVDSAGEDPAPISNAKRPVKIPSKTGPEGKDSDTHISPSSFEIALAQRLLEARREYSDSHDFQGGGNHGGPLPPTAHPLNVASLAGQHAGSAGLLTQGLTQHHQQLAHQYLVQQLQNINPNLNSLSSLASLTGNAGLHRGLNPTLSLQAHAEALAAQMVASGQTTLQGLGLGAPPANQTNGTSFSGGGLSNPSTRSSNSLNYPNEFLALLSSAGIGSGPANTFGSQSNSMPNLSYGGPSTTAPTPAFDWPGTKPSSNSVPAATTRTPPNEPHRSDSSPQLGGTRNSPGSSANAQTSVADWLDILTGGGSSNNRNSAASSGLPSTGAPPVFPWDIPIPAPSLTTSLNGRPPSRDGANKRTREDGDIHRDSPTLTSRVPQPRSESVNGSELSDASDSGTGAGKRSRHR
ncbi:hypothetical protein FRC02_012214 [Tulasnella sp. 418]|nr:hypothetical protein FRC02_012214 [Tulasnella sp. 418]